LEPGASKWIEEKLSTDFCNPATGFTMSRLTPKHFSFNSHLGACPSCQGIGTESFFDPDLVVDAEKTIAQGAVRPWKQANKRMKAYYAALLEGLLSRRLRRLRRPGKIYRKSFANLFSMGSGKRNITMAIGANRTSSKPFEGLISQLENLYETTKSEFTAKAAETFSRQARLPGLRRSPPEARNSRRHAVHKFGR
jgi:excinuclease ABC subunit A